MADCSAHVLIEDVVVYILSTILTVDTAYYYDYILSLKSHVPNSKINIIYRYICVHTKCKGIQRQTSPMLIATFIKVKLSRSGDEFMNRNRFSGCVTYSFI